MADTWWRFYNTAPEHPKIIKLTDNQFRAWATLNSLASKMGGEVPDDFPLIALTIRKTEGKARELIQVLLSAKLLDRTDTGYCPHNWNKKQFKGDNSTERVKRFRKRQETDDSETDHRQRHSTEKKEDSNADAFQAFWDSCPKKVGRGAAEKAWAKAVKLASPEIITAAMRRYAEKQAGKDQSYVKTPGPWLNDKRWEDEGATASKAFEPASETGWRNRLRSWREQKSWIEKWGPDPSQPDCKCPPEILKEAA